MSALVQAVKFRSLADQLNDAEYNRMISRLLTRCSRVDALTWLFKQFSESKEESFEHRLLKTAIDDTSNIIQSRQSNQNEDESDNKTIAGSLSGDLYREIASYLRQKKYFQFSKTNRAIFVGCNSPISLRLLDLVKVKNYSLIDLTKYPQLRHLKIDLTRFNEFNLPTDGSTVCNHLTHFALDAQKKDDIDIDGFMNDENFNFEQLQHLELRWLGKINERRFNEDTFRQLLSKFSMIDSLRLKAVYCRTSNIDDQTMESLLPNISEIWINGGRYGMMTQFIRLGGKKLKSLHFNDNSNLTLPDVSFSNLSHLFVYDKDGIFSHIDTILKSTKNLTTVIMKELNGGTTDNKKWADRVDNILSQQQSLQYFGVETAISNLVHIANGFESGLYVSDHIDNEITIHLNLKSVSVNSRMTFIYISRMLQALAASKRKNYILICVFYRNDQQKFQLKRQKSSELINFLVKHKDNDMHKIYTSSNKIAIYSKDCPISGFCSHLMLGL